MAVEMLRDDWRLPGCDSRCQLATVISAGLPRRTTSAVHDPEAHEEFGRAQVSGGRQIVVRTSALAINLTRCSVEIEGRELRLSPAEWRILAALAAAPGVPLSARTLAGALWPDGDVAQMRPAVAAHSLRITLRRLRHRLGRAAYLVESWAGFGYRLRLESPADCLPPTPATRWARAWDACRECGTTERAHDGGGYCSPCRQRKAQP